ncbi:MAG: hypothetical protein ACRDHZ_08430 [Ktedonobacteraceae bacterium]
MSNRNPPYITSIYQRSCPLTWEWLNNLLFQLWIRGITFSQKLSLKATWEEELQAITFEPPGSNAPILGEALKENIAQGSLSIAFWDGDLQYHLDIDPYNDE